MPLHDGVLQRAWRERISHYPAIDVSVELPRNRVPGNTSISENERVKSVEPPRLSRPSILRQQSSTLDSPNVQVRMDSDALVE